MHSVFLETFILNQIKSYRGHEFQEFGDRLLTRLYADEYTAVRAGGPWGDLKNDGYCHVNRIFFHFYATSQYNVQVLKSKITSDVEGCLEKQQQVRKIVYVTNDANLGVIEAHIDDLRLKHGIPIETWGPINLVEIVGGLPVKDIEFVLRIPLPNTNTPAEPTVITYRTMEESIKTYSKNYVMTRSFIVIFSWIALFGILIFGFGRIYWVNYIVLLFCLLIILSYYSRWLKISFHTTSGKEYRREFDFYIEENDNYKRFRKISNCSHPKCRGIVTLSMLNLSEKQSNIIGVCSSDSSHAFTYDGNMGIPIVFK
jgi:hypothetical protein